MNLIFASKLWFHCHRYTHSLAQKTNFLTVVRTEAGARKEAAKVRTVAGVRTYVGIGEDRGRYR